MGTVSPFHCLWRSCDRHPSCPVTGRPFPKRNKLVMHCRTHTGERPYTCRDCGKSFARGDGLTSHRRRHTFSSSSTIATTATSHGAPFRGSAQLTSRASDGDLFGTLLDDDHDYDLLPHLLDDDTLHAVLRQDFTPPPQPQQPGDSGVAPCWHMSQDEILAYIADVPGVTDVLTTLAAVNAATTLITSPIATTTMFPPATLLSPLLDPLRSPTPPWLS
jgi:hypothetical protein